MFFFDAKCNITYMQAILYMNEKMECTKKKNLIGASYIANISLQELS